MKWRFAGSALLLVAALSGAAAQDYQPDPLSRLDVHSRRQIQNLIDSARLADLPWNALRLKAIEGANKKVEGKRVLAVVREYYKSLTLSKSALGPLASPEEIETGASVLAARVSPEDLGRFRVTQNGRSPMRPLVYLADLIDKHNVPREDAIEAFSRLWKDGAADSDFDGLWRLVDQDILSGVNPRSALQSRMRSLPPRLSKPPGEQDTENPHS
ncbi:MAG TPA: hypothetical protein VFO55_00350 [Gemmatimonadaceae bacterium]|nr:hypothetical protein [Gemmatimonadaceae bacterium]